MEVVGHNTQCPQISIKLKRFEDNDGGKLHLKYYLPKCWGGILLPELVYTFLNDKIIIVSPRRNIVLLVFQKLHHLNKLYFKGSEHYWYNYSKYFLAQNLTG